MAYDVAAYGVMLTDHVRVEAYTAALTRLVTPASTVLDLGAGTGYFTLLAAQLGAQRVIAVDTNPVIGPLHDMVRRAGLADRVEVHQGDAAALDLEGQVDVIVSDLRGVLPLYDQGTSVAADVRRRFLRPGGVLLPDHDRLWAALVSDPDLRERREAPWRLQSELADASVYRAASMAALIARQVRSEQVLSSPVEWGRVEWASEDPHVLRGQGEAVVSTGGRVDGLVLWFSTMLFDGIGYSTEPSDHHPTYSRGVALFGEPVEVTAGDAVSISVRADHVKGSDVVTWSVEGPGWRRAGSTFDSLPLSSASLRPTSPTSPK